MQIVNHETFHHRQFFSTLMVAIFSSSSLPPRSERPDIQDTVMRLVGCFFFLSSSSRIDLES